MCTDRRFIPTRVGNTRYVALAAAMASVHPHARGEHFSANVWAIIKSGSSPRAWGTPVPYPTNTCHLRFIPTRVGNTNFRVPKIHVYSVHPHARGEHPLHYDFLKF